MKSLESQVVESLIQVIYADKGHDPSLLRLIGSEAVSKLAEQYDGRKIIIDIPEKAELEESILAAFCWYYRMLKKYTCQQTKDCLGVDMSSIKINKLANAVQAMLDKKLSK